MTDDVYRSINTELAPYNLQLQDPDVLERNLKLARKHIQMVAKKYGLKRPKK